MNKTDQIAAVGEGSNDSSFVTFTDTSATENTSTSTESSQNSITTMTAATTNSSTITGEIASVSFVSKNVTSVAANSSQNYTEATSSAVTMESAPTLAKQNLESEEQESEGSNDDNLTQFQSAAAAEESKSNNHNPCSNDNPDWEGGTQPCPNSTTDFASIFEGAIPTEATTPSTSATATAAEPETISSSSIEKELPAIYTCAGDSSSQNAAGSSTGNDDAGKEPIYFRFNYEIFTTPDLTEDEINDTLSEFEKKLGYGVAQAVGLVDCREQSLRARPFRYSGGHKNYVRRSLQQRDVGDWNNEGYDFDKVSIEPLDYIDTTLLECTSQVALDDPSKCTPIHGFMSAWISVEQVRNLRQLSTDANSLEGFLLRTVQTYMEQNQTHYLGNDLLHVEYVGVRDLKITNIDPEVLARPISSERAEGNRASSKYIGIGVAGVFLAVLVGGLVYAYRKRDRKVDDVQMDMQRGNYDAEMREVLSRSSSDDSMHKEGEDRAFPSVRNMDSMKADAGSVNPPPDLLPNESTEISVPPFDPNVPSDNLFGLRGRVMSDEYPTSPKQVNGSDDDEMEPLSPTNTDDSQSLALVPTEDDSQATPIPTSDLDNVSESSLPKISEEEENYHSSDKSLSEEDRIVSGRVMRVTPGQSYQTPEESDLSPSDATEKMGNTAPFLVNNESSDLEDELDSQDEQGNDQNRTQNSLPSIV